MSEYNVEINYLNDSNEYDVLIPKSFPTGIIVLWSGASNAIPNGWALCNGSNGTPDLRNRFVVGAGSNYNVGATGGQDSVALSVSQMPSHNHSATTNTSVNTVTTTTVNGSGNATTDAAGEHSHGVYGIRGSYSNKVSGFQVGQPENYSDGSYYNLTNSAGSHTHTISGLSFTADSTSTSTATSSTSIGYKGSSSSHENRPPYYALCYIMKL